MKSDRMATLRERRKKQGFRQKNLYVHKDDEKKFREFVETQLRKPETIIGSEMTR